MSKEVDLTPLVTEGVKKVLKNLSIKTNIDYEGNKKVLTTKLLFDGKVISKDNVILGYDDDF